MVLQSLSLSDEGGECIIFNTHFQYFPPFSCCHSPRPKVFYVQRERKNSTQNKKKKGKKIEPRAASRAYNNIRRKNRYYKKLVSYIHKAFRVKLLLVSLSGLLQKLLEKLNFFSFLFSGGKAHRERSTHCRPLPLAHSIMLYAHHIIIPCVFSGI